VKSSLIVLVVVPSELRTDSAALGRLVPVMVEEEEEVLEEEEAEVVGALVLTGTETG